MNTRSNRPVWLSRSINGSTAGGLTRSSLLMASVRRRPLFCSSARIISVSRSMPRRASTTSTWRSVSSTLRQAVRTMARSSRRPGDGVKMPGVSTNTSCVGPRTVMPRIRRRVVCTLGETMDTLVPTRRFSRVDLPTFGAPRMAMKPQRVGWAAALGSTAGSGIGRSVPSSSASSAAAAACSAARLEAAVARTGGRSATATVTSNAGAWSGPAVFTSSYRGRPRLRACAHSWS